MIYLTSQLLINQQTDRREGMAEMHDLLYRLKLADQSSTQLFEKQLGICLTRYQMLQFLLAEAPCSQAALQEKLAIDPAALTRHFKVLEAGGYVTRSRNPENQREVVVELTELARDRLLVHPPAHHLQVKTQMDQILSEQERNQLNDLLEKLVSGLEQMTL